MKTYIDLRIEMPDEPTNIIRVREKSFERVMQALKNFCEGSRTWAYDVHNALINAHNELCGTYLYDKGLYGAVEQRFKNLFRGHVDDNIEEIGKERE